MNGKLTIQIALMLVAICMRQDANSLWPAHRKMADASMYVAFICLLLFVAIGIAA